jgi:dTDP-glucose 4,6-dehydratase
MIFLVTGGAGFIGSALIRRLIKDKKNTVINVDNLSYSGNLESIPSSNQNKNYAFENCDITNKKNITNLVMKYEPNIIFHLAAESHVDRSIDGPEKFIHTNLIGTFNLLEASRDFLKRGHSKPGFNFKFHHISTDEVYGDLEATEAPFNENSRYKPSSPYAASKAGSDHLVRSWGRTFDIPYVITNCSNNYGPYQFPEKLIPHTIINALYGEDLPVYGSGKQIRDWLHVEDHISALLEVTQSKKINDTYVIGGNSEMENIDVIKGICLYLDKKILKKPNNISSFSELISFVEDRPGHDKRYAINCSKIKSNLSWSPKVDFDKGLKQTIDWYIDNRMWWERVLSGEYRLTRIGLNHDK